MSCLHEPTDELLDSVAWKLTDEPQSASVLARKARVSTNDAHRALGWLIEHQMATAVGNGAWRRFRTFNPRTDIR